MSFNVGDKIRYSDFEGLPGGSVVLFPSGDAYTRASGGIFLFKAGVIEEFGDLDLTANHDEFTLIYLPEPKAADPEVQKLAEELWGVRNDALRDDHLWLSDLPYDAEHRKVYTALAKHVLDRFKAEKSPLAVKDRDGDVWIQNGKGLYDCEAFESYSFRDRTLAAVEDEFGPLTGAGR